MGSTNLKITRIEVWLGIAYCCVVLATCAVPLPDRPSKDRDQQKFEQLFTAWRTRIENDPLFQLRSNEESYLECEEYEALTQLGVDAVPFFITKIEESLHTWKTGEGNGFHGAHLLSLEIKRVTKVRFRKDFTVLDWWHSRDEIPTKFGEYFAHWKELKKELARRKGAYVLEVEVQVYDEQSKELLTTRTKTDLGRAYDQIRSLGIDALPLIMDQLKEGEYDLLPLAGELTDGKAPAEGLRAPKERADAVLKWWLHNERRWTLLPAIGTIPPKTDEGSNP